MSFIEIDGKKFPKINLYPEELKNSWIQITTFYDEHPLKGIISLYIDDEYPKGTIVFSKFIKNKYPDAYISFFHNGHVSRVYTSPKYRKQGILTMLGVIGRTLLWKPYGVFLDHAIESSPLADKTHARAISQMIGQDDVNITKNTKDYLKPEKLWDGEKMPPRNPFLPGTYFYKRIYE